MCLPPRPPPGLVAHSDLDERAIEALKEFNEDGALQVLVQFKESDLSHVQVGSLPLVRTPSPQSTRVGRGVACTPSGRHPSVFQVCVCVLKGQPVAGPMF